MRGCLCLSLSVDLMESECWRYQLRMISRYHTFKPETASRSMQILGPSLCEATFLYQVLVVAEVKVTVTRSPSARPTAEALKYGPRKAALPSHRALFEI